MLFLGNNDGSLGHVENMFCFWGTHVFHTNIPILHVGYLMIIANVMLSPCYNAFFIIIPSSRERLELMF